jgi:hypothetical protein
MSKLLTSLLRHFLSDWQGAAGQRAQGRCAAHLRLPSVRLRALPVAARHVRQ